MNVPIAPSQPTIASSRARSSSSSSRWGALGRWALGLGLITSLTAGGLVWQRQVGLPSGTLVPPPSSTPSITSQGPAAAEVVISRTPIPEYAGVASLVVSEDFLAGFTEGIELAAILLDMAIDVLVLTGDKGNDISAKSWYRDSVLVDHPQRAHLKGLAIPHESMWVRDFGPMLSAWGGSGLRPRVALVDTIYRDEGYLDDTVPYMLGLYLNKSIDHLPLFLDGGSLLVDSRNCYVALTPSNASKLLRASEPGAEQGALAEFRKYLTAAVGCHDVVLFTDPPHAHIDMWAKIVTPDTVLVNELTEESLRLVVERFGQLPDSLTMLKERLDAAARQFAGYLQVERIPMPLPQGEQFATYTNALLINKRAIIPRYSEAQTIDHGLYPDYEARALAAYRKHGLQPTTITSDRLIEVGGALHCAALQLPRLL